MTKKPVQLATICYIDNGKEFLLLHRKSLSHFQDFQIEFLDTFSSGFDQIPSYYPPLSVFDNVDKKQFILYLIL